MKAFEDMGMLEMCEELSKMGDDMKRDCHACYGEPQHHDINSCNCRCHCLACRNNFVCYKNHGYQVATAPAEAGARRGKMKFRKKPVVIDAVLWDETLTTFKSLEFMGMKWSGHEGHRDRPEEVRNLRIKTLEGSMFADKGDWIIKGVKGEFYPCKPDIFEATYEPVP